MKDLDYTPKEIEFTSDELHTIFSVDTYKEYEDDFIDYVNTHYRSSAFEAIEDWVDETIEEDEVADVTDSILINYNANNLCYILQKRFPKVF